MDSRFSNEGAKSDARYRGLLEAAPDAMVVVDQQGQIVLLNVQAEKQFGYHRDELVGLPVTTIIPDGFAQRLTADALRSVEDALAQQIGTGIELVGRRRDGTGFPIEILLSPLESSDGLLVTAAIRNITERKQLERKLHQSQKMEAIGHLTGGIAHDFNNLLGVIIGNLDLLELPEGDLLARKRADTALRAALRGADITRRLLVFACDDELRPAPTSLCNSIQNMVDMATRAIGANITIVNQADPTVPPVFVDPAGLESGLLNLVVNARDAMPSGGTITISTQIVEVDGLDETLRSSGLKSGRYARISVQDTGTGMSRETLDRAFEPFFTTKANDRGTGLGLPMVYGFAKQSGGGVHIYSELGYGTQVSIYLPLTERPGIVEPAPVEQPRVALRRGTVLVVDDEPDLVEVAVAYLTQMGHTPVSACDGESALLLIAERDDIDLLVTDIVMPGMNGMELAGRARALRPKLKVVFSSGFTAGVLAERNMLLIDGPLLHKPYQRAVFAATVDGVLEAGVVADPASFPD